MAKKALLIGINRYKIPGADLRGCVNDVENMRDVLTKYYGFPANGIRIVKDFRATTARMRLEIQRLVDKAKSGDVLLLHYSGHGSNVPDKNGDEADGRDEILCPTDLDWYDPLTDDWIRKVLDGLPPKVNLTVVFDCCHSGTATREPRPPDAKVVSRYLPCPLDVLAVESGRALKGKPKGSRAKRRGRSKSRGDVKVVNLPETLLTGCRADQTSADAYIRGSYNGAMTYSLVQGVKKKRGKLTYRELHKAMLGYLRGKYSQVPQLEGKEANLKRTFLEPF